MVEKTQPGITLDAALRRGESWPTDEELPFSRIDVQDPRISTLLQLARRMDLRRVKYSADNRVDLMGTADHLYRAIEAQLRTEQCLTVEQGICKSYRKEDIASLFADASTVSSDAADFLLYRTFGIAKDHALTVAR
jgi:hypothetical protein